MSYGGAAFKLTARVTQNGKPVGGVQVLIGFYDYRGITEPESKYRVVTDANGIAEVKNIVASMGNSGIVHTPPFTLESWASLDADGVTKVHGKIYFENQP